MLKTNTDSKTLLRLALAGALCIGIAAYARTRWKAPTTVIAPSVSLDALKAEAGGLVANVKAHPQDVSAHWKLFAFDQKYHLDAPAMEQLKQITLLTPKEPRAPLLLSQMYLAQQQYEQAEIAYRAVVIHFPARPEAWQGLGSALFHEKRYYEATEAGKLAVKVDPTDPNGLFLYASASLEYAYQFPNPFAYPEQLVRARSIFTKLTTLWPQNGTVYFRLARAEGAMHNTPDEIKHLCQALALLPDNSDVATDLIRAQLEAGLFDAARQSATQAIARHPDDALLYALMGRVHEGSAAPDAAQQAYACFVKAAQLQPGVAAYQEHLGTASLRVQKLDEARQAFERAAELSPNRSFAYQQLALTYNRLHNPAMARKASQQAAALVFNEQQLKRVQNLSEQHPQAPNLHLILADRYRDMKLFGAAHDQYLTVLKLTPDDARAKQGLQSLEALAAQSQPSSSDAPAPAPSSAPPAK